MKKIIIFSFLIVSLIACKNKKENPQTHTKTPDQKEVAYNSYGKQIEAAKALSMVEVNKKYNTLTVGDTLHVKFASKINSVCAKKGCWMRLDLGKDKEVMVRFKDYGFFMPLDSKGKEVIVNGKAYVKETSVDELRHYAEDAGKSKEEIEAITEPKKTLAFLADGVLMKK